MLAVIYIFMVISVTLFPVVLGDNTYGINSFRSLNYTPLTSIWRDIEQIGTAIASSVIRLQVSGVKN